MKKFSLIALLLLLLTACHATPNKVTSTTIQIPNESTQLLVVTTDNWSTKEGKLQRYEKIDNHWRKIGKSIEIVIGRNGLGWGRGLHQIPKEAKYIKKEGDGKAPAGLFALEHAFGYAPNNFPMQFPYVTYSTTDHCVDDSNSKWYNQIIDSKKVTKDYKSFEYMKLRNNLYKYGITVAHNPEAIPQAGSCIFIHIKNRSKKGTAGCTAMREDEIVELLKWLKEEKKPLLLQLPKEEIMKVKLN